MNQAICIYYAYVMRTIFHLQRIRTSPVAIFVANGILRLCDAHNIPFATNIATGEVLIHGLERGDLEWRNLLREPGM